MSQTLHDKLNEKIPRSAVSERDGGGGRRLSYLEGHYVINRLNEVFGAMGWSKEILDVRQVVNKTTKGEYPAYLVKVRLTVAHEGIAVFKEGYGYGSDKSPQNAHELAIKEAVTDALKVAAKDLGMSMGLALYDKSQEYVEDDERPVSSKRGESKASSSKQENVEKASRAVEAPKAAISDSLKLRGEIQDAAKNLLKSGVSIEDIKEGLKSRFSASSLSEIKDEQLELVKIYLIGLIANNKE